MVNKDEYNAAIILFRQFVCSLHQSVFWLPFITNADSCWGVAFLTPFARLSVFPRDISKTNAARIGTFVNTTGFFYSVVPYCSNNDLE